MDSGYRLVKINLSALTKDQRADGLRTMTTNGQPMSPCPPTRLFPAVRGRTRSSSPQGHSFGHARSKVASIDLAKTADSAPFPSRCGAVQRRLLLGSSRSLGKPLARAWTPGRGGGCGQGADQAGRRGRQGARGTRARRAHPRRAGPPNLFASARMQRSEPSTGLNLDEWVERCRQVADDPPRDPGPIGARSSRVFAFQIEIDPPHDLS